MGILHLITNASSAPSCLSMFSPKQDTILLAQDGVYTSEKSLVPRTFAIERDVAMRGLIGAISGDITLIDYKQFVDLVVEHESIITWR